MFDIMQVDIWTLRDIIPIAFLANVAKVCLYFTASRCNIATVLLFLNKFVALSFSTFNLLLSDNML